MRGWASGRGATGARQHGRTHVARLYAQVREPVSAACEGSACKESGPIGRRAARTLIERTAQVEPARHVAPTTLSRPPMPSVGRQDRRTQGGWTRKGSAPDGHPVAQRRVDPRAPRAQSQRTRWAQRILHRPRDLGGARPRCAKLYAKSTFTVESSCWQPFRADRMYQRQVPAQSGRARSTVGPARPGLPGPLAKNPA